MSGLGNKAAECLGGARTAGYDGKWKEHRWCIPSLCGELLHAHNEEVQRQAKAGMPLVEEEVEQVPCAVMYACRHRTSRDHVVCPTRAPKVPFARPQAHTCHTGRQL